MTAREECTCITGHGGGGRLPMDDCPKHSKGGDQNNEQVAPDVAEPWGGGCGCVWNKEKGTYDPKCDFHGAPVGRIDAPGPSAVVTRLREWIVCNLEMRAGASRVQPIRDAIAEIERLEKQISLAAQALVEKDIDEAYHRLYEAMDPNFEKLGDPFLATDALGGR